MADLLAERVKLYGILMPPFQMVSDNVAIFRLPMREQEQTSGGLWIPERSQGVDNRGVLLAAGLKALDIIWSRGIELGHIVLFGDWAGRDKTISRDAGMAKGKEVLLAKADDISASYDLLTDIALGRLSIERNEGEHFINDDGLPRRLKEAA